MSKKRKVKDMDDKQRRAMFANLKDGKQHGRKTGGKRRNKTNNCRHPKKQPYHKNNPPPPSNYQVRRRMKKRSKHAQAVDRGKQAKKQYDIRNKTGKTLWYQHPEQYDIKNVDNKIAQKQYQAKKSKKQLKTKKRQKRKTQKKIRKTKRQIQKTKSPRKKKQLRQQLKIQKKQNKQINQDVKNINVTHRKTRKSIWEKRQEKKKVMYIMKNTDNNNYIESKALLDKVESHNLSYDQIDWDELQGSDLTFDDKLRRLEKQTGHTRTQQDWKYEEEEYKDKYQDYLHQQRWKKHKIGV